MKRYYLLLVVLRMTQNISNNIPDNMEEKIKIELMDILSEDVVKVIIEPNYDIPVYVSKKDKKKNYKKILVLSGGGIMGMAYTGALQALQNLEYLDKFEEFAGSSVGTFMICMYLLGYTPEEMWKFTNNFNYDKLKNINFLNIISSFGVDDCSKVEYMIDRLIQAKGFEKDVTLRDLFLKTNKKVTITATCVNTMSVEYLNHENSPNLPVATAIRMSISIPWFYKPCKYNNKLYVDGGLMDNYPISIYNDRLDEVVGMYIHSDKTEYMEDIKDLETYSFILFQCFNKAYSNRTIDSHTKHTIDINIDSMNAIKYKLSTEEKLHMYTKGFQAVTDYFSKTE